MKKKYETLTSQVVEFCHNEDLLIAISGTIEIEDEIRSGRRGWDSSDWSGADDEELE